MPKEAFKTIDEYIATFPENIQNILEELRQVIRDSAPNAEEAISYQMPRSATLRASSDGGKPRGEPWI